MGEKEGGGRGQCIRKRSRRETEQREGKSTREALHTTTGTGEAPKSLPLKSDSDIFATAIRSVLVSTRLPLSLRSESGDERFKSLNRLSGRWRKAFELEEMLCLSIGEGMAVVEVVVVELFTNCTQPRLQGKQKWPGGTAFRGRVKAARHEFLYCGAVAEGRG